MKQPQTWREFLAEHLNDPQERQRIASALEINPVTLTRWTNNNARPRPRSLRRLLDLFPQYRELLHRLIEEEFKDFWSLSDQEIYQEVAPNIPVELFTRVFHTLTTLPKSLLFSAISDLILQQALNQLDPQRLGMAILIACCMTPSIDGKVQSLREIVGRGTAPWASSIQQQGLLLGAESLAGHAVISGHMETNLRLKEQYGIAPGYRGQWEESAVAVPIMYLGKIAGCLLVSSTLPDYFTPEKCSLVEQYAELLFVVFDAEDFYELAQIELKVMPSPEIQSSYLATFQEYLMQKMRQAQRDTKPMTLVQAEQAIWQQIEQELLKQPSAIL